ncbi:MAG: DNA mismatch repair protein MutS [Alphaproteobacteria bacterium]
MAKRKAQAKERVSEDENAGAEQSPAPPGAVPTPVMAQFLEIKAANTDCLLFYRMGDFYELFFDDAVKASRTLGIALTKRGKHLGEDIPMCGVPVRAADEYLQKLIRADHRVAICEQMEDPAQAKKRGYKSVVRREVVRLVTPGTITEDALLKPHTNNYLTSVFRAPTSTTRPGQSYALASLDISTGEFILTEVSGADLDGELSRLEPGEIIAGDDLAGEDAMRGLAEQIGAALTPVPRNFFDSLGGERDLKEKLGVADLAAFGDFTRPELAAAGALLKYIDLTQLGKQPLLRAPRRIGPQDVLMIDASTRINLELVKSISGERRGSLLHAIDRTVTGAGARELAVRLASPLTGVREITARLDAVSYLLERGSLRGRLREGLKGCPDLARGLGRLTLGRGGPRDLGVVRDALASAQNAAMRLEESQDELPDVLASLASALTCAPKALEENLRQALAGELPVIGRDGGFVRDGYNADLDENRALRDKSRQVIAGMQQAYAQATGVKALKVRHNNVLGYFVEVPAAHGARLMDDDDERFIHRQTMASAMRFTTRALGETEARIVAAADRAIAIEQDIFDGLVGKISAAEAALGDVAGALAALDHYCAITELAEEQNYVRPRVDRSGAFVVEGARHPVVEQALKRTDAVQFVENDCVLSLPDGEDKDAGNRISIVTGPNMAGKSTYLRQNALIVILAQMGSFVPARNAHTGVVDRLFSRVGASDDLAGGRSTFMVEMVETARILNQATKNSFVILDEIGRGTATFDGLSIAWACVEHLHGVNGCRALFATHYHELTALAGTLEGVGMVTMQVKEWHDEIIFLHKVVAGAADRSYGIHVAKLAGLPEAAVARAQDVLRHLEGGERAGIAKDLADDLPLFAATPKPAPGKPSGPSEAEQVLQALNPDELSPKQALEALYEIKALLIKER